ncbi:MAG: ATP-binding cassette domain-containing protein, partial [Desulfobacterales bacterium]
MNIVECVDVTKTYEQGRLTVEALKDISLQIDKGEFLAVAGPSGSGKTTLLNMIGGLDMLDSGSISVDGEAFESMSQSQLASLRLHKIGFVFQAYNLIPVLSA